MIDYVNFAQFCDRFRDMDRNDNFSYFGKQALFNYLEDLEEDTAEQVELDVIALCCDYSEYSSIDDLVSEYDNDEELKDLYKEYQESGETSDILDYFNDRTTVITVPGGERFVNGEMVNVSDGYIIQAY